MSERTRRTRIVVGNVEAKPSWDNPKLVFTWYTENERREVILTISHPYDITQIRNELNKVADYWKKLAGEL